MNEPVKFVERRVRSTTGKIVKATFWAWAIGYWFYVGAFDPPAVPGTIDPVHKMIWIQGLIWLGLLLFLTRGRREFVRE